MSKINKANLDMIFELETKASLMEFMSEVECLNNYDKLLSRSAPTITKDNSEPEALLDAMVWSKATRLIVNKIKDMKINENEFGWREMAVKVSQIFNDPDISAQLEACNIFGGRDTDFHFVGFSPFLSEPSENKDVTVKKCARKARDVVLDKIEPKKMKAAGKKTPDPPSQIFKVIMKVYNGNGKQPINFYNLILNPDSFSATVENLFYTSFLFNEGQIRLFIDSEMTPFIEPIIENENNNGEEGGSRKPVKANIFSIAKIDWKNLLRSLNIEQAMLPKFSE